MKFTVFYISLLFLLCIDVKAQAVDDPEGYYFAGATAKLGQKNLMALYAGGGAPNNFRAIAALPVFRLNQSMFFMAGYMNINYTDPTGKRHTENHFLPSLIINLMVTKHLTVTNRNMFFYKDIKGDPQSFYRNRLGLTYYTKIFGKKAQFFAHDAIFVNLNKGDLAFNRVLLGAGIELTKFFAPQIQYIRDDFRHGGTKHSFYFIFTVPLQNYGIFKTKKERQEQEQKMHPDFN